jgi:hypothetical protein
MFWNSLQNPHIICSSGIKGYIALIDLRGENWFMCAKQNVRRHVA